LVSDVFYEPHNVRLVTSAQRVSADGAIDWSGDSLFARPITWVDTSDEAESIEQQEPNDTTLWNAAEVSAVLKVLELIAARADWVTALASQDDETPIGVISMYSGQKEKLETTFARQSWEPRFRRLVRIDTVDAYQGKENAIVIVSLVRSNQHRTAGHVNSPNRCNVAMSRAKERLIIVGARNMWGTLAEKSPMRRVAELVAERSGAARVVKAGELR
jgi:AAA domain